MTTTHGSAKWQGGIKDGKGAISTKSGALADYPYGFASRFEGKPGSNPEELIGAAHAACFTMALSLILGEAKLTAEHMETRADVTLEKVADGFAITAVHLTLSAKIPGADNATFQELAGEAGTLRHQRERKIAAVDQALGALHAQRQCDLQRRGIEVLGEQPRQMPRADAEPVGQRRDIAAVECAGFDQRQRALDGRPGALPCRAERRRLGTAAQAGPEAGALG